MEERKSRKKERNTRKTDADDLWRPRKENFWPTHSVHISKRKTKQEEEERMRKGVGGRMTAVVFSLEKLHLLGRVKQFAVFLTYEKHHQVLIVGLVLARALYISSGHSCGCHWNRDWYYITPIFWRIWSKCLSCWPSFFFLFQKSKTYSYVIATPWKIPKWQYLSFLSQYM